MSGPALKKEKIVIKEADAEKVSVLASALKVDNVLAKILVLRGLDTYEKCKFFFNPSIENFHDPFLLDGMQKSAERIVKAIKNDETIAIHGDYDVDGITSTVLLCKFLSDQKAKFTYYLPNRLKEGYGISLEGVQKLYERGSSVIVTVDCGIAGFSAAEKSRELGVDLIITDHHEPKKSLPDAFAIIDPKLDGCKYPFRDLAGVGVAFKLCQAVTKLLNLPFYSAMKYLDIVSVGTAADIVPLKDENRLIAYFGYKLLHRTKNYGLKNLLKLKKINKKELTTSDVVFMVAPSINASGRLGDPYKSIELLICNNEEESLKLAEELIEFNNKRGIIDRKIQESVFSWIEKNIDPEKDFAIVKGDRSWHQGVIGISASKVVERYYRPAFLFAIGEDGIAKGSGRSVKGVNLLDAVAECEDLLVSYGGHEYAAGASIKEENLDEFSRRFNDAVKKQISIDELRPIVLADCEISLDRITKSFYKTLKRMEPFGPSNMRPVFASFGLNNKFPPKILKERHLKMNITKNKTDFDAIAFNMAERENDILKNNYSIAYTIDENVWQNRVNLQLIVKGIEA